MIGLKIGKHSFLYLISFLFLKFPLRIEPQERKLRVSVICKHLVMVKVTVKQSRYRPGVAQRIPGS